MGLAGCGPDFQAPADEGELETGSSELSTSRASLWFPLATGNSWTLAATSTTAIPATRTVSMTLAQADSLARLNGLTPTNQWIGVDSVGATTLNMRATSSAAWAPFIRFGYAVSAWTWGSGACGTFTARRLATDDTITTEAGYFTGVRTLRFELKPNANVRCAAPAFEDLSFAPGVGLIAMTTPGGERYLLKSAKVGSTVFPLSPATALSGTLTADAATYTNKANSIVCITTPCPSNEVTATAAFTFKVKNTASVPVGVNTVGCLDNFELVDSSGQVIKSFNEARFCEPNSHSTVFAPGETKTFSGSLALSAGQLQLLGHFTARAYLTQHAPGGPLGTASVGIVVKAAP